MGNAQQKNKFPKEILEVINEGIISRPCSIKHVMHLDLDPS